MKDKNKMKDSRKKRKNKTKKKTKDINLKERDLLLLWSQKNHYNFVNMTTYIIQKLIASKRKKKLINRLKRYR